jgi:hypothetical protein
MKPYLFLALAILFASCQHALVPVDFNPDTSTRKHVVKENEGITLIMENIEVKSDLMVFDVEVINTTNYPIWVNPDEFRYLEYWSQPNLAQLANNELPMPNRKGRSANEMEMVKYYEQKIKSNNAAGSIFLLMGVGLLLIDSYQDAQKSKEYYQNLEQGNYQKSESIAKNMAVQDAFVFAGLTALDIASSTAEVSTLNNNEDLHFLSEEILSPQLLAPGNQCRGKVFFKKGQELHSFYRFLLEIESIEFKVDLRKAKSRDRQRLYELNQKY